eukprot:g6361.t1
MASVNELINVNVENNTVNRNGSAYHGVFTYPADSTVTATNILGLRNEMRIFNLVNSTFKMSDSLFEGNRIDSSSPNVHNSVGGSVIYSEQSNVTIINSTFKKNTGYNGGAVDAFRSKFTLRNCMFQSNSASYTSGGAFHAIRGNVVMKATEFNKNEARFGGACFVKKSKVKLRNVNFSKNVAVGGNGLGGAIYHEAAAINGRTLTFLENQATALGGALYILYSKRILLTDVHFGNNRARNGGAIHTYKAGLELLSPCKFIQNHGSNEGGGIWMSASRAFITSCDFNSSNVLRGGALRVESNSSVRISGARFINGTAYNNGGAIDLVQSSTMIVSNANFSGNHAGEHGGAINVNDSSTLSISNTTFESKNIRNNAQEGGGISVNNSALTISKCNLTRNQVSGNDGGLCGTLGDLTINHSRLVRNRAYDGKGIHINSMDTKDLDFVSFVNNSARNDGGSIWMKNSHAFISFSEFNSSRAERGGGLKVDFQSVVNIVGCKFSNGNAAIGGAIDLVQSLRMIVSNSNFSGNIALAGGGIHVDKSVLTMSECKLTKNYALVDGGGIRGTRMLLTINHSRFVRNRAHNGGGIYLDRMATNDLESASFANHSALSDGGGIWIRYTNVLISNSNFIGNKASGSGAGLHLSQSNVTIRQTKLLLNKAKSYAGIYGLQKSNLVCTQTSLIFNTAVESGGGVGIDPGSSLRCFECEFKNNSARRGAGLYIESHTATFIAAQLQNSIFEFNFASEFGGGVYFSFPYDAETKCSNLNSLCPRVVLLNVILHDNTATISGPAVFTADYNGVLLSCNYSQEESAFLDLDQLTLLAITDLQNIHTTYRGNCLPEESTGGIIGTYGVAWSFSINPKEKGEAEIIHVTDNQFVLQNLRSGAQLPAIYVTIFDELGNGPALTEPESFVVEISSPDEYFPGIVETNITGGTGSFPNISSLRPPGNYTLRIRPISTRLPIVTLLICIRLCQIGEEPTSNGELCQECDAVSYNFNPINGNCTTCPNDASCESRYIIPNEGFWHKSPCHVNVMRCLNDEACQYRRRQQKLANFTQQFVDCSMNTTTQNTYGDLLCHEGYEGPLCGSCQKDHGLSIELKCSKCPHAIWSVLIILFSILYLLVLASFTIRGCLPVTTGEGAPTSSPRSNIVWNSTRSIAINLQMVEMMRDGYVPREVIDPTSRATQSYFLNSVTNDLDLENELEITKWIATEILKILINFLQVTAIAASINVRWREEVVNMFEAEEYIGALTTAAISQPIDCILGTSCSTARLIWRTLLILFVPVTAVLCFVSFWGYMTCNKKENMSYFWKRSILSIMAVTYISYLGLTKLAVRTFYCVSVYDSEDYLSHSTTSYWAVDTSIKCYGKNHIGLVIIGAFILVFVSLSFPLASASVIIKNKSRTSDREGWMFETMGFLYRTFKENLMFWETVVMFRKACLSIIVVFPYPLGGQTQGLLAQIVLTLSLCGHMSYLPYKEEFHKLNLYEFCSLFVSCFTFLLGQFFNDEKTGEFARGFVSFLIISMNSIFFLFLAFVLVLGGIVHLKVVLKYENVQIDDDRPYTVMKAFLAHKIWSYYQLFR